LVRWGCSAASAAGFTVNSVADSVDSNLGDGSCADAGGFCTLRAAIGEVNALGGLGHTISFNIPGPAPHQIAVATALPSISAGVDIDATTEPGLGQAPRIILDGTGSGVIDGLRITGSGTTIRGFVVQNFGDEGIEVLGDGNTVAGNYVGVRVNGFTPAGNDDGILVRGANNTIGGPSSADRNVVGGNSDDGISLDSGDNNTVRGNYVGVTADGTGTVGNGGEGIAVQFGAADNNIRNNVVSGNTGSGILLRSSGSTDNQLIGNTIGTNPAGTASRPNGGSGVRITNGNFSFPGAPTGTRITGGNVISGNAVHGIHLDDRDATGTVIRGNYIGTNAAGTSALANAVDGIYADADAVVIGGTGPGQGNLISGNGRDGIRLERTDQIVRGNLIGTNALGNGPIPNGDDGIDTGSGTSGSQIGGIAAGAGNTIAFNGGNGIVLREFSGTNGAILGNSIYSNAQLGINLRPTGELPNLVTPNDFQDGDNGPPNNLINFPVITFAGATSGSVYLEFDLDVQYDDSPFDAWYRIEFFSNPAGADPSGYGEGQVLVASTNILDPGFDLSPVTGSVIFPGAVGDVITATATHCTTSGCTVFDRTSEFSPSETVVPGNNPPALDPIGPQSGDELTNINFTVSATDPDSDGITFEASGLPSGATFIGNAFSWTPTEAQGPGIYNVTITVRDNGLPQLTDFEVVAIAVGEVNVGPVLDPVGDRNATEFVQLSFTATASDSDLPANTLTFSLLGEPTGAAITAGGVFTFTPDESQGGNVYTFDVVVTDSGSPTGSDSEQITVTVAESNESPVLAVIGNQVVPENSLLGFTATATDSDVPVNTLVFTLEGAVPAGAAITAGGVFTFTPDESQGGNVYTFDVVVTDDGSPTSAEDRETITVTVNEVNTAPFLTPIGDRVVDEETQLSFTAIAIDTDQPANTLTFSLLGAPTGASIDAVSGVFAWTPGESQGPGVYVFDVVVTDDGSPNLTDSESITVTVDETNRAPILLPIPGQSIPEQTQLTFSAVAYDPDDPSDTLAFSLSGQPPGASINSSTGLFSWTPTEAQGPGPYTFDVVVTDDGSPSRTTLTSVSVDVTDVNRDPSVSSPGNQVNNESDVISLVVTATDPDLPANILSFAASGLPDGLIVDPATGEISGTLARPANFSR